MDLAAGDYEIWAACAGVPTAELTVVTGGGPPETMEYPCGTPAVKRFERHPGGPLTIRAEPLAGQAAVAGVTVGPNRDRQAARSADLLAWSRQQLKPAIPGELFGSGESNTAASYGSGRSAAPGKYELHFLCQGPAEAELSVSTPDGTEVLAPVQVPCGAGVFRASVQLATEGAEVTVKPAAGPDCRYAYRLVPHR